MIDGQVLLGLSHLQTKELESIQATEKDLANYAEIYVYVCMDGLQLYTDMIHSVCLAIIIRIDYDMSG